MLANAFFLYAMFLMVDRGTCNTLARPLKDALSARVVKKQ